MCIIWVILIQLDLSLFSPPFVGVLKSGLDKQLEKRGGMRLHNLNNFKSNGIKKDASNLFKSG